MLQFYFLSVATNIMMGVLLVFQKQDASEVREHRFLHDPTFLLVVAVIAGMTALFKLLSPIDTPIILGDFLPAMTGIAGGLIFLARYLHERSIQNGLLETIELFSYAIGIACIVAGVLHFLFPQVVIL